MSAANRRRGHDAERTVTAWFRRNGYPDARTTRSALGHDGAHAPGDVEAIPGLIIEVKDVAGSRWPTWCVQAAVEAQGRPWVVIRRRRGVVDVGEWDAIDSATLLALPAGARLSRLVAPLRVVLAGGLPDPLPEGISS